MAVAFQVVQLVVTALFVFHVFDVRNKPGMQLLAPAALTLMMKLLSFAILGGFIVVVVGFIRDVTAWDAMGLALTGLGTWLATRAKRDLGQRHTWTGYCLESTAVVTTGIYGRIRHPLYTGIYLFELGALCVFLPRVPLWMAVLTVLSLVYVMPFNAWMASRESAYLTKLLGDDYADYARKVHAFLPLWKYAK